VNESYGKYDLQLIALVKTPQELAEAIASVKEIVHITDIAIAEFHSYLRPFTNIIPPLNVPVNLPRNKKNQLYKLNHKDFLFSKDRSLVTLDDVDKKIIRAFLKDPRIKFSELSEKTGINHETLRYRIGGYVKRGFIVNFGLLHDFQKYGLYTTYLLVNASSFDTEFMEYLEKEKNVFYAARLMGTYGGIIYLVSHTSTELGEKLKGIRKALGDKLLSFDLIHMEKIYKYVQFPERELE
jgi:DNA-binding Lrp family transcriptional regulator